MLFHLEPLEEKEQNGKKRETKLDHRNYHDFDNSLEYNAECLK